MKVRKTYKYRMYDGKQNKHLSKDIDLAAEIWNHCIALHRRYYKLYKKHLSTNRLKVHLTKLKKQPKYSHWNNMGSQAIQDVAERIGRSYDAFFKHRKENRSGRKSPPKFRKRKNYASFTLKQAGYKFIEGTNRVTIMGRTYKYVAYRPLEGNIKTLTIKRTKTGKYFLFVSVEQEWPEFPPRTGNAVGTDFGLKMFLTKDTGEEVSSPQWFKEALPAVRKANRKLSTKQMGSNNRARARFELDLLHEQIANKRTDWFFKLADQLTKEYAIICIEDLNIDAMKRLWGRKISDLAFSEFVKILEWEAFKNNARLVKVSRWYPSSKTCRHCGYIYKDLDLKERQWTCPHCNTLIDRDHNAAINIRREGLRSIGMASA